MTNDKYIIGNQGKTEFTKQEITEIERLLTLLRSAPSHKQKKINNLEILVFISVSMV